MSKYAWPPEIDIFEISGLRPNRVSMTNHFGNRNGNEKQTSGAFNGSDFSNNFHKFALEWDPKKIMWYVDEIKVFETDYGIPDLKMFLVLSVSLGGGKFSGKVDNTTPLPSTTDVDYIRVYKQRK